MKACSFLPAATAMIQDMGLEEFLCGVTFECPSDKPAVVRSLLEHNSYGSGEIDAIVSQAKAQGQSLYWIDEPLLQQIAPDLIFTQDLCEVCQIDTACVQLAVSRLAAKPALVPLLPVTLADVFQDAITIARALGREERAHHHLAAIHQTISRIRQTLEQHKAPVKKVVLIEWMDPVYNCGHWIPDMIATAGGKDLMGVPGGYSGIVPWEKITACDPQVLIIAPCGFKPERTITELDKLSSLPGWNSLYAVRNGAVYIADGDLFTCPSTRLVQGIQLLAALLHPDLFDVPASLSTRFVHVSPQLLTNRTAAREQAVE